MEWTTMQHDYFVGDKTGKYLSWIDSRNYLNVNGVIWNAKKFPNCSAA